jgi:hypothetical protein
MGSRTWHETRNVQFGTHVRNAVTFADAVNQGRVGSNVTIFTLTGRVLLHNITAYCTTLLTKNGAATMSLGTASVVAAFIAATDPTVIDANEWWEGTTPIAGVGEAILASPVPLSESIVVVPAADDITAGVIVFDAWYDQITDDGALA